MAEKFFELNEELNKVLQNSYKHNERDLILALSEIREEFLTLTNLTKDVELFISPLILACYGYNVYSITVELFFWIAPFSNFSFEQSFYVNFAFFQFFFRVLTVTYFVSEVHHVSQYILRTIQSCSNSVYTLPIKRIEQTLSIDPIGIKLFGTFLITRRFFISIISFIFTTEIVLLQTTGATFNSRKTK
ncbi:unnamed protein product [Orchesella dallaii]|uniref:Uncharacterized protein n=1 Tax=Orchesella dallaii TaxID=48710 RepID=A0ABP1S7Q4_9HEXA